MKYDVIVKTKLNKNNRIRLINYLASLTKNICFFATHDYHLDQEVSVELLNVYKKCCIEKHHDIRKMYEVKDKDLMKALKKLKVNNDELFEQYLNHLFEIDFKFAKRFEENLNRLENVEDTKDYTKIFPEIANDYIEQEIQLADIILFDFMPADCVIYKKSKHLIDILKEKENLSLPILINEKENVEYVNTLFESEKGEFFASITTNKGIIELILEEVDYQMFKNLKIRHKKELIDYENESE